MEYYVFPTEVEAIACVNFINSTPWFPIVGKTNGVFNPDAQQTTYWVESPVELISGEWAVPRIPESRLDCISVTQEQRDAFLVAFGQDIRDLSNTDFPEVIEVM